MPERPEIRLGVALQGAVHSRLALAAEARGDFTKATQEFEAVAELSRKAHDIPGLAEATASLASLYREQHDYRAAVARYDEATRLFDQVRGIGVAPEIRTLLSAQYDSIYVDAVAAALEANDPSSAFLFSERAEARSLLDRLGGLMAKSSDMPSEVAQALQLHEDILRLKEVSEDNPDRKSELDPQIASKEQKYFALEETENYRQFVGRFAPEPQELGSIQGSLDLSTTLVSYFPMSAQGKTVAFVVTKAGIEAVDLNVDPRSLTAVATPIAKQDVSSPSDEEAGWRQLSKWLFDPIASNIKTDKLAIVARGDLNSLPFAQLPVGDGKLLIDKFVLFYLPSASTLLRPDHSDPEPRFLAVYQPQGVGVPDEKRFNDRTFDLIAAEYHATVLRDDEATESAVRKQMPDAEITYIVAHAAADSAFPSLSELELKRDASGDGGDGRLTVDKIYGMQLKNADLVVLAACETGRVSSRLGDDAESLNRAFHAAGAASVVSTLRIVDSGVAEALMEKFFAYLKQGKSKAEALALAQRGADRTQSPDWAAFVLTGRPGS
jgi:CHAT domain-containing protein